MTQSTGLGPLALVGSGEYTPTMDLLDRYLIDAIGGRPVLLVATACAMEGLDVMERWEQMGVAHFCNLGVEAIPLRVCDTADADNPEHAQRIAEAGLVWFSGGTAAYLAQAWEGTRCWQALEDANRRGAAVAGSSGGLGVLNANVPNAPFNDRPGVDPKRTNGLGLAAPTRALAHFDRMEQRRPEFVERIVSALEPGQKAVGVDEDTALVWHDGAWRVIGHKRAVVYESDLSRVIFHNGDHIKSLPPPERANVAP